MRIPVFVLLALGAGASQACYSPPPGQLIGAEEQLRQARDAVLGQVIAATPLDGQVVEYRFLVLEQLAGAPRKVLTVLGGPAGNGDGDSAFDHHREFAFWARGGGRTMNGSDCLIRPGFVVGGSYLVFPDAPPTRRSFEKIEMIDGHPDPGDRWLAYVRQALAGTAASREAAPDYERIGRILYGFQRRMAGSGIDLQALAAQHPPSDLLLRAGRLSGEVQRIVGNPANIADAHAEAALREADEVEAALQAWRKSAAGPG